MFDQTNSVLMINYIDIFLRTECEDNKNLCV